VGQPQTWSSVRECICWERVCSLPDFHLYSRVYRVQTSPNWKGNNRECLTSSSTQQC